MQTWACAISPLVGDGPWSELSNLHVCASTCQVSDMKLCVFFEPEITTP